LQPEGETLAIEVKGGLAGILSIAAGRKLAPKFSKPGRKSEEAPVEEIISQVEMVAGAQLGQFTYENVQRRTNPAPLGCWGFLPGTQVLQRSAQYVI